MFADTTIALGPVIAILAVVALILLIIYLVRRA
jgi:hypothetical protein